MFKFEQDFTDTLRCIPMLVRYKLDTCGIKLKLNHWNQLSREEKEALVQKPCSTPTEIEDYRQFLQALVTEKNSNPAEALDIAPNPPWLDTDQLPGSVQDKAAENGLMITVSQWRSLTNLQRFALIKLSRASHENHNFYPALQEFGLVQ
ncbi:MAG: nitrate reductase associated protein [Snowella sp.]|nr:nitrate reductase associated protein [Snowella sp.]